jgi:hypothetical protein
VTQPATTTWTSNENENARTPRKQLIKIRIPANIYSLLATAMVSDIDAVDAPSKEAEESSRTELDSHANMLVIDQHAYVISDTGRIADVNPFTPDYNSMQVPIVDAALQYHCPYDGQSYILVIRNELHVPSMKNNLIPPFVLREAGIRVQDTLKIQVNDPSVDDHSLCFPETGFRIPLSLWGMFSYFPTSKPTPTFMQET